MAKRRINWNRVAGDQLRRARMNLEPNGATQERIADLVGLKQPTLSQIENGARRPSWEKMANLFHTVRPGLDPERERFFLEILIEHSQTVDFASKLGLKTFAEAKARARSLLDFGGAGALDTWYVLRAVRQLATTGEEKAYAEMLMGNRFKDLGIWETERLHRSLAEEHYNAALSHLSALSSDEAAVIRDKVLVNLASQHVDLDRPELAEAIVTSLLSREKRLAPEVRAEAYFVRGRVHDKRGAKAAALKDYAIGRTRYTRAGKENNADWILIHEAVLRCDIAALEALINRYEPKPSSTGSNGPIDPENYYWSVFHYCVLTGNRALAEAVLTKSDAGKFRHLVAKVKTFLGDPAVVAVGRFALILIGITATALGVDGILSEVLAKSCN